MFDVKIIYFTQFLGWQFFQKNVHTFLIAEKQIFLINVFEELNIILICFVF